MTGREKWDAPIVPKSPRKKASTATRQGGKGSTVSQQADQLELSFETADSPQGDVATVDSSQLASTACAVPKSENTTQPLLPAMTMSAVASLENLEQAFQQVYENKGAAGPDRQDVETVKHHLSSILPELRRRLLDGTYQPGLIRRVWIPKPGGRRGLGIPNVVDRLVGQAVHQILSPHYELTFHPSSHGFRPERSCHTAIAEARKHLEAGRTWVVDLDLEKFFDRVHHDRLLARLGQQITDDGLLRLIRRMLRAKVVLPNGVIVNTEEGTPQGGPLSPLLSNIVLDELDWELARRGHRFVRYADDANIYVAGERSGRRVMSSITRFIEHRLRLKVNQEKSAVARPAQRHFLGFRLSLNAEGEAEVLLSQRSVTRIYAKLRQLLPGWIGLSFRDCIRRLNQYLAGWVAFFRICTPAEAFRFEALDGPVRRRLRAIVLRRWKTKRTIYRRLLHLGVKQRLALTVYSHKRSWWALARSQAVHTGLSSAWFQSQGVLSLYKRWQPLLPPRYRPSPANDFSWRRDS